jgi:hypothetical protein
MEAMESVDQAKRRIIEQVDKLLSINNGNRFELWKYFEDNANKLQSTLWDQGKWLLAIQGGVLFLPFTAQLIKPRTSFPFMTSEYLFSIFLIYLFGIVFSAYALALQKDLGKHISRNFDRAICARDGSLCSVLSPLHRISVLTR